MIRRFPLARLALVLLLAAGVGWMLTHRDLLRLESIEPALRALGIWAPIGFVLIYATATVLFFSGGVLGLAGGALFGPVWGTLWNLIAATLGATAAFLLARTVAREWVARHGSRWRRIQDHPRPLDGKPRFRRREARLDRNNSAVVKGHQEPGARRDLRGDAGRDQPQPDHQPGRATVSVADAPRRTRSCLLWLLPMAGGFATAAAQGRSGDRRKGCTAVIGEVTREGIAGHPP